MISSIRKAFDLIITSSLNTTVGAARHNATGLNVLKIFQIFFTGPFGTLRNSA